MGGGASDAFIQELNDWKLYGAAAWHLGLFLLGTAFWHLAAPPSSAHFLQLFSFSTWFFALLVYAGLLGVLLAQRRLLTTLDVPPLHVARLGWSGKSWPSLLLARCFLRRRRLADVADVALLYGAAAGSACAGLFLLKPAGLAVGRRCLLVYGCLLGVMYGLGYLVRAKNVLSFPILQRHRYFRIKQRMRALARSSLLLPTVALLPALLLTWLLPGAAWGGPAAVAACWQAAVLICFGWGAGAHCLEVVFSERVALAADDDPLPTPPLLAALQHADPIVQDWCLQDLAAVAEGAAGCAARRADLFSDESGAAGWVPVARYCLAELRDFVAVMGGALPAVLGAAAAGAGVRWNMLQLSAAGGRSASRQQDLAVWHLQARYYRLLWCMRVLSGLAAAGLQLDSFGLLQLCSPGLTDVLAAQLGVVAVLTAFLKHTSSIPVQPASPAGRLLQQLLLAGGDPGGAGSRAAAAQHVDVATAALLDAAKTCTYRITNAYGEQLMRVVGATPPLVGSSAEAAALLASFLAHQE